MSDVFISYSRKDIAFAKLLNQAFEDNELVTWIDWSDIPPAAKWLNEVYEAIENANVFVFIISKTSVISEICGLEITHALENGKRCIPIVIDDTDPDAFAEASKRLADIQWLNFREADKFENAFDDLVEAVHTDYEWVKENTRLQLLALEWERKDKKRGYLLRGRKLKEAEAWLADSEGKKPQPTALHKEYLEASRKYDRWFKRLIIGGTVTAVLVVGAAVPTIFVLRDRYETQTRVTSQAQTLSKKDSALFEAINAQDPSAVKKALEDGGNLKAKDGNGDTALHSAVMREDPEVVSLLVKAKAPLEGKDKNGYTPLHNAAGKRDTETAELLIKAGADLNGESNFGTTPLYNAVKDSKAEMTALLIKNGADVNVRDDSGYTLLHEGVSKEILTLLLEAGIDINARDDYGSTPLHNAANGNVQMTQLLIEAGANVNAEDNNGWTPLYNAASNVKADIAAMLVTAGADVNARNNSDQTPLNFAVTGGNTEMAELLRKLGGVE